MEPSSTQPLLAYLESLAVALATGAQAHFCYANVWNALRELETLRDVFLLEGWVVIAQARSVAIVEHCWCLSHQQVLDPSLVLLFPASQPLHFVPGIQRTRTDLERLRCSDLPLASSGSHASEHQAYREAYQAARAQAAHLANVHRPPKTVVVQRAGSPGPSSSRGPTEPATGVY